MMRAGVFALMDGYVRISKYGRLFRERLDEFLDVQAHSPEVFAGWRLRALEGVLDVAKVANWYSSLGRIQALDDFPLLSKDDYRKYQSRFVVPNTRLRQRMLRTSGSTGAGLNVLSHADHIASVAASWWAFRGRFGIAFGDPGIVFGGRRLFSSSSTVSRPWLCGPFSGQTLVSTYHLDVASMAEIAKMVSTSGARWIHGYPSALVPLARFMCDAGVEMKSLPMLVSTGSESISREERHLLSSAFGAPVSEYYGQVEGVCSLWRCEAGRLHDQGLVGSLELAEANSEGQVEIVGTGYWNRLAPMVRYRTGDWIIPDASPCSCGNPFPVGLEVDGRTDDFVVTSDGRRIGRLARLFTYVNGASRSQLVQRGLRDFVLRINENENVCVSPQFKGELERMLGEKVTFKIERVDALPRSSNGKVRSVLREFRV